MNDMKILITKHIGFCPGVKRAYTMAMNAFDTTSSAVFLLGELVHNHQAVRMLEVKGARLVNAVDQIPEGATVVTRSHGLEKEMRESLLKKGITIIDTTCPRVRKVQLLVSDLEKEGFTIIILGDPDHAEIKALVSELERQPMVFGKDPSDWDSGLSSLSGINKIAVIEQTTFPRLQFEEFNQWLRQKHLSDHCVIWNTLCPETENRQNELLSHLETGTIDVVVILGGKHSSNTRGLYLVARDHAPQTIWVEDPDEIQKERFQPNQTVLIVSGASTPDQAVKELIEKISSTDDDHE